MHVDALVLINADRSVIYTRMQNAHVDGMQREIYLESIGQRARRMANRVTTVARSRPYAAP